VVKGSILGHDMGLVGLDVLDILDDQVEQLVLEHRNDHSIFQRVDMVDVQVVALPVLQDALPLEDNWDDQEYTYPAAAASLVG